MPILIESLMTAPNNWLKHISKQYTWYFGAFALNLSRDTNNAMNLLCTGLSTDVQLIKDSDGKSLERLYTSLNETIRKPVIIKVLPSKLFLLYQMDNWEFFVLKSEILYFPLVLSMWNQQAPLPTAGIVHDPYEVLSHFGNLLGAPSRVVLGV